MSMSVGPVSEVYQPEVSQWINDVESAEHYDTWGYRVGEVYGEDGNDVPPWGDTAIFRIGEDGMTEPVYVTKPEHTARFTVDVLAGRGALIRAFASGATELVKLQEGDQVIIKPGQAYSYVNSGKDDLVLHDVALPAFRPGDDVTLTKSGPKPEKGVPQHSKVTSYVHIKTAEGKPKSIALPTKFYDMVGQAAAGTLKV